jgi:hypothetical protein
MNTISNALNFGGAFNNKISTARDNLGAATSVANSINSAVNPVGVALGTSQTNQGTTFQNPTMTATTNPASSGLDTGMLSANAGIMSTHMPLQAQSAYQNSPVSNWKGMSEGTGFSQGCCFIFMEALNGPLPEFVRECRDHYYSQFPDVAAGYKRMAKWLVPAMKHSSIIKFAVNRWMVQPMVLYGGFLTGEPGYESCECFRSYKDFWFRVWSFLGRKEIK